MEIKEITDLMKAPSEADILLLKKALSYAEKAHAGQARFSGEPYIIHPFETAKILAEMKADTETIAAGLLHDTIEDCGITKEDLEHEFGPTVAFLVEGVSKLGKLKYRGAKRHTESLRKLFVAMAQDIRVILIRLADRLHNVQTLKYLPLEKQKRISSETLEIYAPLANRLGIWRIKGMLEDAAFPYAYPTEYKKVVELRKTKGKETIKRLEKIYRTLERELAMRGLKNFTIDYRIKYLYSLYEKLLRKNMDIDEIYDISALRVIVGSIEECYQVLGVIHSLWRPIPGRLKDYIASPKPNGYQSIHTSIFSGEGNMIEIQIRTREMQQEAEYGIASHIAYDEAGKPEWGGKITRNIEWIKELIEWQKHMQEDHKFISTLKTEFFHDRIFVFTPKGEVVELPKGSSPIDFAFKIHSEIGVHAYGARVSGKMVSLDTPLKNGDLVEIIVNKNSKPSNKWLAFAKTSEAKKKIKSYLQSNQKVEAK